MNKRDQTELRDKARGRDAGGWWASGWVFRGACALLGVGAGALLALLLGFGWAAMGGASVALDSLVAAGAMSGAVCGSLAPGLLLNALTGLAHFLAGLISALGSGDFPDAPRNEGWLKACAVVGALYAVGLSVGWGLLH